MYKQSSSWNQRSKGFKLKTVLQICLLLAVCFWLLYQVKHSHDKKKEFDEADAKALSNNKSLRLGRKDIRSQVDNKTDSENEIHDETSEEEEITEEVEENKHDEVDPEDKKVEEREDGEAGGRDDETEEHGQEKSDAEIDRVVVDGEDREDVEENDNRETDSENGHGQTEKESTVDDTEHDSSDSSAHEAREEHYKADDASSSVTHDAKVATEDENANVENSNEHPGNILQEEKKENNSEESYESESRKDLEVDGSKTTAIKDNTVYHSENDPTPNNATTEGSADHFISTTTSPITETIVEKNDLPSENATESKPEIGHGQANVSDGTSTEGSEFTTVDPELANDSILSVESTHSDSNSTRSAETEDERSISEEFIDSSNNSTDSSASDNLRLEASNEEGDTTESSENNNEFDGGKSDTSHDGTDESLEGTSTDNPEEVEEDAIDISDTSDSMEEKDVLTDLETLPKLQTEGTNADDVAAE